MKRILYIAGSFTLTFLMPFSPQAQNTQPKDTTTNRTVVIEQEYDPDILGAPKVNMLPEVEEPIVSKKEVEYTTTFFSAISIPADLMRPYVGTEVQPGNKLGYIRAGYGNYGNLNLFVNYLSRLSDRDKLNVRFQMDGMDDKLTMPETDTKRNAYYYHTRVNIDYIHQFDKVDLNIAVNFGPSSFNLSPVQPDKQKFVSGDFHLGIRLTDENYLIQSETEANLMMYNRQSNNASFLNGKVGETQVHTKGLISDATSDEQNVNVGLDMCNLIYNKDLELADGLQVYENRTVLALNPYYKLSSDSWDLRAGANVDISFGSGKSFRVSPDVAAQYIFSDSYILYARVTGGKPANGFRRLETICSYALPTDPIFDTYKQLNATTEFKASPYPGLRINLYDDYQGLEDDFFEVQEEALVNYDPSFAGDAQERDSSFPVTAHQYLNLEFSDASNFYADMKISYEYKDFVALSTAGTYHNWDAKERYSLYMKPTCEISFSADFRPTTGLSINLGYDYIGHTKTEGIKAAAISDLRAEANYNVFKGVPVYTWANNILNKKYQYYPDYPIEGPSFLEGLDFSFWTRHILQREESIGCPSCYCLCAT